MRSLLATEYRYITGPMPRTQQAWDDYAATLSETAKKAITTHFIPAFGGCFVVIEIEQGQSHSGGWWSALALNATSPGRHVEMVLDGFSQWLETQEAQKVVTPLQRA